MILKPGFLTIALVCLLPLIAFGDSSAKQQKELYSKFERLLKAQDNNGVESHLKSWQEKSPNDAELAVAWANYYGNREPNPIQIYTGERNDKNVELEQGGAFSLQKEGTSETVGYIDTRPRHSDDALTRALAILRDASTTHPKRTDIWMGAAHIQLMAQDREGAFDTLQQFARYASKNPKGLLTRFNEPVDKKAEDFMPETLHKYALRAYREETSSGLELMLKIARLTQELYPKHPYAYNDEAVYYNLLEDDAKVLECLLRAHQARPKDALVILNIGATYKNLKQRDKAREFFGLAVRTTDDDELKEAAREELKSLDKK